MFITRVASRNYCSMVSFTIKYYNNQIPVQAQLLNIVCAVSVTPADHQEGLCIRVYDFIHIIRRELGPVREIHLNIETT